MQSSQRAATSIAESQDARPRRRRPRATFFDRTGLVVALVLAVLAAYPLGRLAFGLFWNDGRPSLAVFEETLGLPGLLKIVLDTVGVVAASSILALIIGAVFAWLNERTDARFGFLTDTFPLLPFLIPPVAGAIGWVLLLSPRAGYINGFLRSLLEPLGIHLTEGPFSIFSWYGLVFVLTLYQVPYAFLMIAAGLRSLDPVLEEQSRISGAGLFETLRRVTLRALGPSIGGAVLLMAWQGFALFSVPAIIGSPAGIELLPVSIVKLLTFTYPPNVEAALGLSTIVVGFVTIAWLVQRRLVNAGRNSTFSGKAHQRATIALRGWRWPLRALMLAYIAAAAVLPLLALLVVSLNGFWTLDIDVTRFSLDAIWKNVFQHPLTLRALLNSLGIALVVATIGVVTAALVSQYLLRNRGPLPRLFEGALKLPAVVSHIVVAVAIVVAFAGPPFRLGGTVLILGIAYLVLYLPQALVSTDAAVGQVGSELPEASRLSGASDLQTFRRINLPIMLGSLVVGWSLLFTRVVGDLTASALLSGTGNPVVGFRILEIYNNGSFAGLAALTLVLVTITFTIIAVLFLWQRRLMSWSN